ncbi:MAG: hypothetical protein ACTHNW_19630 [Mucilaginibacter sp.]
MSKNVADQLVSMLVGAGIKRIYAVTGDSLNEVMQSGAKAAYNGCMCGTKKLAPMRQVPKRS